jgi:hypothetical protein
VTRSRISYFIPESPGPTHAFFWREREAMRRQGVDAEIVSTRRPPSGIVSHSWSLDAMAETEYWFPLDLAHVSQLISSLTHAERGAIARADCRSRAWRSRWAWLSWKRWR